VIKDAGEQVDWRMVGRGCSSQYQDFQDDPELLSPTDSNSNDSYFYNSPHAPHNITAQSSDFDNKVCKFQNMITEVILSPSASFEELRKS